MALCHKCGYELAPESGFCPMCGVALENAAPSMIVSEDPDEMMARMFDSPTSNDGPSEPVIERTDPALYAPFQQPSSGLDEAKVDFSDDTTLASDDAENERSAEPEAESQAPEQSSDTEPEPEVYPAETSGDPSQDLEEETALDIEPTAITEEVVPSEEMQEEPQALAEPDAVIVEEEMADADSFDGESPVDEEVRVSTNDFDSPPAPVVETSGETATPLGGSTSGKKSGLKPLAEGTLLNSRYQIVKKIGGGGMGAVYLACDQNLGGIERAVKEMVQSSIEEDQQNKAVEDFKRESTILSTLDHPSIPTIYDYFFDDHECRFYLVMKYISGGDLAGRLRSTPGGRVDEKTVTEWAIQVADVLSYLHNLPTTIVYRDLKPSNIMLDGTTGKIMLIDFGIARSINQEEKGVTAVGTMGYAPPELFSGQVEPRSDIYSLGSTMFHLLTGADPQNNPLLIFDFQKNPRPRQINPQMSDQMERILMRSVEYKAESRFPSADALKRALIEHLERLKMGQVTFGVSEAPAAVSLANQFVFCGFCGQQIVATDLFCAFCGAKQPIAQQGVHADIYPRTGATAKLIVDGTSELDAPVFSLERNENLLGRRDPQSNIFPEVDLSKYDPQTKISRRHARIWRDGGSFMVEDLGSSNGTVLLAGQHDSIRLQPRQPHPLASGDRIRLGDTTLHFLTS
jgi:tRNA A-37 threonylcarbamoyl transferase component Bud32